ncbi:MAG: S8 family serine peptidase [Bacteroidota bacterium]|jgi:subtilisin family serine protease
MRIVITFLALLSLSIISLHAQQRTPQQSIERLERIDPARLGSGRLYLQAMDALRTAEAGNAEAGASGDPAAGMELMSVAVYMDAVPTPAQLAQLQTLGVRVYPGYWTPPADNHPNGFFLAEMPAVRLPDLLDIVWIRRLGDASGQSYPENNEAARTIGADRAWVSGLTGKGVRVGVLDSGIDLTLPQSDLPVPVVAKDYSLFPRIDDDVRNRITPHGTHVAGSVLGRGVWSAEHSSGGAFRGMAPDAELVFFKIGNDTTASSEDIATIAALHDAVAMYDVDIINMSYGGWGAYHDGSEPLEQKADWCFDNGTAVFFSAGNSRGSGKHYSTWVDPQSESDFIEVHYSVPQNEPVRPSFNMIWYDGQGVQLPMSLKYFDENKQEITNLKVAPMTESPRGTQSQYSSTVDALPPGDAVRFLKIANGSTERQFVHLYEDMMEGNIWFTAADPNYTIGSPSVADRVMSVAAFTSRSSFLDYSGARWQFSQSEGNIASFSSLGPRPDGAMKPDIAAPGTGIISVRDKDMSSTPAWDWVDNDGVPGGDANYQAMQGTSMASPICAGAAALVLEKYPQLTPGQLYDTLRAHARRDPFTGTTPNATWGSGKLDVGFLSGLSDPPPVWVKTTGTLPAGSPPVAEVAAHPSGTVFAVTADGLNGDPAVFRSSNSGANWTQVLQKPALNGLCVLKDGSLLVIDSAAGMQYRSANQGNAWTEAAIPAGAIDPRRSSHDSLVVIATTNDGPHFSSDNGATWNPALGDLPAGSALHCVEGGTDGWMFAAVMEDGKYRMYRGHRANWQWERKDGGITSNESVVDIRMLDDGTMIAATERRVYRSENLGDWWEQTTIVNGENRRLHVVGGQTVLLVNKSNGVHRSVDGGRNWELFNRGLDRKDIIDAETAAGSGWCAAGSTVYRCAFPAVPGVVQLSGPADGNTNAGTAPTLTWTAATNAAAYRVQIGRGPDLREVLLEMRWHEGASLRPAGLAANEEYYWRVRGVNATGEGSWSAAWSFMTGKALPSIPVLLTPEEGAISALMNQPMVWERSRRGVNYDLQISTDPLFSSLVAQQQNMTDTAWTLAVTQPGVIHYWRVRARNGQGYSDWSRTRYFQSSTGPGDAGYALLFDHRGDLVSVPHSTAFDDIEANDELTFEAWVKIDNYDSEYFPVLDKYNPDIDWGWQFAVTSGGMDLNLIWASVGCSATVETGSWQHVAVSYKRSEGVARFFINGNLAQETATTADVPDVESEKPLLIGNGPSGGDEQAFGMIDEVRIWNVARSEQQIRSMMKVPVNSGEPGLVLRMAFDEGSGMTTQDASAHAPMAALVQHPEWTVSDAVWSAPAAPRLLSPADAATKQFPQPLMRWSSVTSAETYQLQVAANATFTSPIADLSGLTRTEMRPPMDLASNTTHYWRVRASNAIGDGAWSAVFSYKTAAAPPLAPRLSAPTGGSTAVALPPVLRWESSDGATAYRVQVGTESVIMQAVFDSAGISGTTATIPGLAANTTYYWHVAATNVNGSSSWSETWIFTTASAPLTAPVLLLPVNDATAQPDPSELKWSAVNGAAAYDLQAAGSLSFLMPVIDTSGISGTSFLPSTAFGAGRWIYWRVRARDVGNTGPWSDVWRFRLLRDLPEAAALKSPDPDAENQPQQLMLLWKSLKIVDSFRVQISALQDFASTVADVATTDSMYIAGPFAAGSSWYWHVRGENERGAGPWSEIRRFTIDEGTGISDPAASTDFRILSIYPHPVAGTLRLRIENHGSRPLGIRVCDLLGRTVYTTAAAEFPDGISEAGIVLPSLRAGWYILRLQSNNGSAERMFLYFP